MPYRVFEKSKGVWCLEKLYDDKNKNYIIKKKYKERKNAVNAAKNFIRFRKGSPIVRKDKIYRKK
tara:strand:- start:85 stop:279 length:195 start_codon:yes stop_codon:yes gene_type:complete